MKEIVCTVICAGLLVSVVSGYMIEKDRREYLDHWSNPDRVRERIQQAQTEQIPQWTDETMVTAGRPPIRRGCPPTKPGKGQPRSGLARFV